MQQSSGGRHVLCECTASCPGSHGTATLPHPSSFSIPISLPDRAARRQCSAGPHIRRGRAIPCSPWKSHFMPRLVWNLRLRPIQVSFPLQDHSRPIQQDCNVQVVCTFTVDAPLHVQTRPVPRFRPIQVSFLAAPFPADSATLHCLGGPHVHRGCVISFKSPFRCSTTPS